MGTRHSTLVQVGGDYKIAQYGQWDGYPEGQGLTILKFLSTCDLEAFKGQCAALGTYSEEETETIGKAQDWAKTHPHLSRDAGGAILQMVADGVTKVSLRLTFPADSLFCEWCYVVDFDKGTFEVFRGFNRSKLDESERFYGLIDEDAYRGYEPVKFVKSWPLAELPTEDEFLATFGTEDES